MIIVSRREISGIDVCCFRVAKRKPTGGKGEGGGRERELPSLCSLIVSSTGMHEDDVHPANRRTKGPFQISHPIFLCAASNASETGHALFSFAIAGKYYGEALEMNDGLSATE